MLYAHAVRSYVFAALLARHDRMHVDDEALYVGCVLHDIGLTPDYEQPVAPFEQVSADIAVALAGRFGWPSERRETLADAIVLHMAAEVGADESPEARALEAGVAVDCTGRRLDDIAAPAVAEVLRQLPRGPFKRDFAALLKQEATRQPDRWHGGAEVEHLLPGYWSEAASSFRQAGIDADQHAVALPARWLAHQPAPTVHAMASRPIGGLTEEGESPCSVTWD
jgi:hypothetical protein